VIFREGDLDADSKAYSRDQEDSGGRCLAFHLAQASGQALVWDPRPGIYYLEWWDGGQRLREVAGETPSQVIAAQRRKEIQLAGGTHEEPDAKPQVEEKSKLSTPIAEAKKMFLAHIQAHSRDKPETVRRYRQVLDHFERLTGHRKHVEAITRADIDDYKRSVASRSRACGTSA
jgi:hypothetical protein